MTSSKTNEIIALEKNYMMNVFARYPIALDHGKGARVWDVDGKVYLDFFSGIAVNALGYGHPRVVEAIKKQAEKIIHACNYFYNEPQTLLAKKLVEISDFDKVFFCNSGAEANEAAIKIARKHGKKNGNTEKFTILAATRSFHGRTMATLTATGQEKYQTPFTPLLESFHYVEYNDCDALKAAMNSSISAVLLEPIQGEGGVYPATNEYLKQARALCDEFDAMLIFDEVQTGVARSGTWFAHQQSDVVPDIMTLAKALGGGLPIGACLTRGSASTVLSPGDHGSTFGGNPLVTAVALEVLNMIEEEKICAHVAEIGAYLEKRLADELAPHKFSVRGKGLMLGVEFVDLSAKAVLADAMEQGLLLGAVGDRILRLLPPLIITKDDVDQAVAILKRAVNKAAAC